VWKFLFKNIALNEVVEHEQSLLGGQGACREDGVEGNTQDPYFESLESYGVRLF